MQKHTRGEADSSQARAHARSHARMQYIYALRRAGARAPASYMHNTEGTSVQRTPSILNPDPGLLSVFTCKWSTTICGPSRLLASLQPSGPRGREPLVRWEGLSDRRGPRQMGSRVHCAKHSGREREREGRAWQPLKQQGLPHIVDAVHALVPECSAEGGNAKRGPPACERAPFACARRAAIGARLAWFFLNFF